MKLHFDQVWAFPEGARVLFSDQLNIIKSGPNRVDVTEK
jgi:hypothetical protein